MQIPGQKTKQEAENTRLKALKHKQKDQGRKPCIGNSVNREKIVEPFKEADLGKERGNFQTEEKKGVKFQRKEKKAQKEERL
ncbi:hypothetical protein DKX38_006315 [Salix brachista]|uniref:Uncharacterized protein n=1 Tax=Salix brachista TaxID=2182728 RepID=A0A5N5N2Y7_9ROSI|nr:hypothetical protein DKX38_006315 [Salix brachista]